MIANTVTERMPGFGLIARGIGIVGIRLQTSMTVIIEVDEEERSSLES